MHLPGTLPCAAGEAENQRLAPMGMAFPLQRAARVPARKRVVSWGGVTLWRRGEFWGGWGDRAQG